MDKPKLSKQFKEPEKELVPKCKSCGTTVASEFERRTDEECVSCDSDDGDFYEDEEDESDYDEGYF